MNSSAALKAFVGRHGGAVCTSTNARAVLEWALGAGRRRQGALLPRPAPRPQHRPRHGLRPRRHAGVEPAPRARRAHRGRLQGGHLPAVEGPLLGAPALPARARRGVPGRAPRRHRRRPPRVRPRACASWPTRSARPTSSSGPSRPRRPGSAHRRRHRDPPRAAAGRTSTPTRPSCRSTRSSARARRCSASTPPTWRWVLENLVEGRVVNRITVDAETAEWAQVALQRMLDIT